MKIKENKYLLLIAASIALCIAAYFIYDHSSYITFAAKVKGHKGTVLAEGKGILITEEDLRKYKLYNYGAIDENFTDEEILSLMVEEAVVLEEAKDDGIKITKDEVNEFLKEQKYLVEQVLSKEDKKAFEDMISDLGMKKSQYWDDFAPIAYARILAFGRMREILQEEIKIKVLKNSTEISSDEFVKQCGVLYDEKIETLKGKYKIKQY